MIGIIAQNLLFQKALADSLADFNPQIADTLQKEWEAAVVYETPQQTEALLSENTPCPIILIGTSHEKAFCKIESPCRLNHLKSTLNHLFQTRQKAPRFENDTFIFLGTARQITHKKTGKIIYLCEKENDLIIFLVQQNGEIVSKDDLLTHVWNYNQTVQTHTIETHIYKLRQKLGGDAGLFIKNTTDGYCLVL